MNGIMARFLKTISPIALLLAGCDGSEPGESRGSTTPPYQRAEDGASPLEKAVRPVRIGELGPAFAACNTLGTTRARSSEAAGLSVRAAPYQAAHEIDRLPAGARFFVCSRSIDQKWFGLVYAEGGAPAETCGVSRPIPARRDYEGPCRSGWVSSASVTLTAR
jgi:hypothetical protein